MIGDRPPRSLRPRAAGAALSLAALSLAALSLAALSVAVLGVAVLGVAGVGGAQEGAREVSLGASGDLLAHLRVVASARRHRDRGGFVHTLRGLKTVLRPREVAFLNLETPLSTRVPPETGDPPVLGAPPDLALALADVGVDVVSVANNHSYDQTARGLVDTLDALDAAGVQALGAGRGGDADPLTPWVTTVDGVRVAWLAVTERVNRGAGERPSPAPVARDRHLERVPAALRAARGEADLVVLSVHWSHDFVEAPSRRRVEQARTLVEAGADVILGHGPHLLQRVDRLPSPRGEAVVAYSLGNVLSNQGLRWAPGRRWGAGVHPAVFQPGLRDGVWLRLRLRVEGERVSVADLSGVPLFTDNGGADRAAPVRIAVLPLQAFAGPVRRLRRPAIARALGERCV